MSFLKLSGFKKFGVRENYAVGKGNSFFPKGTNGRSVDLPITVNGKPATIRFSDASTYSGSNDWNGYLRFDADGLPGVFPKGAISAIPSAVTKFGDIEFSRGFDPRAFKGTLDFKFLDGTSPEKDPFRAPKNPKAEAARVAAYKATRAETSIIEPKVEPLEESANAVEAAKAETETETA